MLGLVCSAWKTYLCRTWGEKARIGAHGDNLLLIVAQLSDVDPSASTVNRRSSFGGHLSLFGSSIQISLTSVEEMRIERGEGVGMHASGLRCSTPNWMLVDEQDDND